MKCSCDLDIIDNVVDMMDDYPEADIHDYTKFKEG